MDGRFVPNLTFGPKVLKDITAQFPELNIDIHFMIEVKESLHDYLKEYITCRPKSMTMHIESLKKRKQIEEFIYECHTNGVACSLALSPKTKVIDVVPFLEQIDGVLVMSVEPGFGGQSFIPSVLEKIRFLTEFRKDKTLNYDIQVDGGINLETGRSALLAGANQFVAGNSFFHAPDKKTFVGTFLGYEE